jgi:hypothetical protein
VRAQVGIDVTAAAPLALQAENAGATLQTLLVPAGTNLTNVGAVGVGVESRPAGGLGGETSIRVTPSSSVHGTTCEIVASARYFTGLTIQSPWFGSQESGAERIELSSPTPIGGVVVAKAQFTPSAGYGVGTASMACDFGDDGSVELTHQQPAWHAHSAPVVIAPGRPFVLRMTHQGALAGTQIGDYSMRLTVRVVEHADGLAEYGPSQCAPTLLLTSMTGTSLVATSATSPAPDLYLVGLGFTAVQVTFPLPTPCPLLTSAEVIAGPFAAGRLTFAKSLLPRGARSSCSSPVSTSLPPRCR